MSRIGKKPITVPAGVTATIDGGQISVKGPKGTLAMPLRDEISYTLEGDGISVVPANDTKRARAFWGMQRTMVQNLITGVSDGFTKKLLINGVGYRAAAQGRNLNLKLGYSHDVNINVPEGIEVKTPDNTTVEISGTDNSSVAQARALQGQGHQVRRRVHLPQGREEEVMSTKGMSLFEKRRRRNRTALRARGTGRPRLSIHRSGRHIYAQIIDDAKGVTVASASTLEKDVRDTSGANVDAAVAVGTRVAEAAKAAGVTQVVFDRGGFLFHGRVKALAQAAREAGLEF
jgi:large subunit ribosomal protein L6